MLIIKWIIGLLILAIVVKIAKYFLRREINDVKHRAKQEILKETGFSESEINEEFSNAFEKNHLERFLKEHPEYTEEKIKNLLATYALNIVNRQQMKEFSPKVSAKIEKDSKITKLQNMQVKRVSIGAYINTMLSVRVIFTDNRNEYVIYLECTMQDSTILVDKYKVGEGAVVGF